MTIHSAIKRKTIWLGSARNIRVVSTDTTIFLSLRR
ncbi:MAG: spore coat protein [Cytophagales bacterium]|nr:spore coat protein [Cytophagales bacterium]MCA6372138.1 spore coat protein [Cytophagales bacterium]MCA6382282.1 spore coat protein [Cytophagales bacterium]